MKLVCTLSLYLLVSLSAAAQLKLARLFSDHAVLQRRKPIPVWGWATKGDKITVQLNGQAVTTQAGADGRWQVRLRPMEAGGPYTLMVKSPKTTLTCNDLLVGKVWICAGQSNMEMTVAASANAPVEVKVANYPEIRQFKVPNEIALQPQTDLTAGDWQVCSPQTVGAFSGVGYFFARQLAQTLHVPVGLVNTAWGGSQLEGWISREGYTQSDELRDYLQTMPSTWDEANRQLDGRMKQNVFGSPTATRTTTEEQRYTQPGYDFSGWHPFSLPGQLDWQGAWAFRGQAYLARTITIPADVAELPTTLGLGVNESECVVYINGKQVDKSKTKGPRVVKLPPHTWQPGTNSLVLHVGDAKDPDWWGVGMSGSVDDVYVSSSSGRISLAGDAWKYMPALAEPYTFARLNNNVGTTLYNAIIQPIVPYAMQGVLWYQGETNTSRAYQYRKTFPLLIQGWRSKWQENFPFLFVQLPAFGKNGSSNDGSNWAELRESQAMALSLPNTGMVVATDLGDPVELHPKNKQDVSKRLVATALHVAYGQSVPYSGPMMKTVSFGNRQAVVSFNFIGEGLQVKDKYGYLRGFELAGRDKVFHYAKAEIVGDSVVVSSAAVPEPVAVRYAWTGAPVEANLYNADGFPAAPFRSDNWKGVTEGNRFQ